MRGAVNGSGGGRERRGGAPEQKVFSGTETDRHLETDEKIPAGKRTNRHFPQRVPREWMILSIAHRPAAPSDSKGTAGMKIGLRAGGGEEGGGRKRGALSISPCDIRVETRNNSVPTGSV